MTRSRFPLGILVLGHSSEMFQTQTTSPPLAAVWSRGRRKPGTTLSLRKAEERPPYFRKSHLWLFFFLPLQMEQSCGEIPPRWKELTHSKSGRTALRGAQLPVSLVNASETFSWEFFKFPLIVTLQSSLKDGWGESGSCSGRADFRRLTACLTFSVTHRDPWPLHPDPASGEGSVTPQIHRPKAAENHKVFRAGQWLNHSGKTNTDFSYKSIFWDSIPHWWLIPKAKQCN